MPLRPRWILLSLLGGSVVTVGVAWWAARWPSYADGTVRVLAPHGARSGPTDEYTTFFLLLDDPPCTLIERLNFAGEPKVQGEHVDSLPTWIPGSSAESLNVNQAAAFGWPLRALSCWTTNEGIPPDFERGIWLDKAHIEFFRDPNSFTMLGVRAEQYLPLRPIFTGFLLDILFYAALLYLFACVPVLVIRWRRHRRGRCPACGYPLGESDVCTECGASVKVKRL